MLVDRMKTLSEGNQSWLKLCWALKKVAEFRLYSAWLPHYAGHPFVNTIVEAPPDKWIIQDYWTEGKEGSFLISPDGYGLIQNGEFLSKV